MIVTPGRCNRMAISHWWRLMAVSKAASVAHMIHEWPVVAGARLAPSCDHPWGLAFCTLWVTNKRLAPAVGGGGGTYAWLFSTWASISAKLAAVRGRAAPVPWPVESALLDALELGPPMVA